MSAAHADTPKCLPGWVRRGKIQRYLPIKIDGAPAAGAMIATTRIITGQSASSIEGTYRISLDLYAPNRTSGIATIKIGDKLFDKATRKGDTTVKFESIFLEKQDARLSAWIDTNNQKKGPRFVEIEHLDNTRNHN